MDGCGEMISAKSQQGEARARRARALEARGRWAEHRTLTNIAQPAYRQLGTEFHAFKARYADQSGTARPNKFDYPSKINHTYGRPFEKIGRAPVSEGLARHDVGRRPE